MNPRPPRTRRVHPFPRGLLAGVLALASAVATAAPPLPEATPGRLPRWRGFTLLEKFQFRRRADVAYEEFHGHCLDRQFLEFLRRY